MSAMMPPSARLPANPTDAVLHAAMAVEERYIAARRAGSRPSPATADAGLAETGAVAPPLRTGLALSGGGIRSATFSLGILQALSRGGLLPWFDYLSTVSGGSYIGSFFGALYVPPDKRGGDPADHDDPASIETFAARPLQSPRGRRAVANLREFGRYLTPGGASDTMYGVSLFTRNWISLQIVLGIVPLFLFLGLRLMDAGLLSALSRLASHAPDANRGPGAITGVPASIELDAQALSLSFTLLTILGVLVCAGTAIACWFSRRESVPPAPLRRLATNAPFIVALGLSIGLIAWIVAHPVTVLETWGGQLACLAGRRATSCGSDVPFAQLVTAFVLASSVAIYISALVTERGVQRALHQRALENPADEEENVRSRLTRRLATVMLATMVIAAGTLVDFLGGQLTAATRHFGTNVDAIADQFSRARAYGGLRLACGFFWPFLAIAAPAILTVWAHASLRRGSGPGWLTGPSGQAALGLSILFFWMVLWAAIARAVDGWTLVAAWLVTGACIGIVSLCYGFLNQSSLVSLYSSRLKRAYIGASNASDKDRGYDIGRNGDTIAMHDYYGQPGDDTLAQRRPVHLINVTIAQTQPDGASHVVAYDRKGKPMHVSPSGLIYEAGGAGLSARQPFGAGEPLSLSTWTAISGAAASTAIGGRTSLGLSIMALMANVRLGYWWKSTTREWYKPLSVKDTVLGYLLSEMQSSFATDDNVQRWYLSDGGHFENTGVYALLQRRLDFIVACDNGADPDYQLDDVVRLIDRARADLKTEVRFFTVDELDDAFAGDDGLRRFFGTYVDLATPPPATAAEREGRPMPYATLAWITYDIDERQIGTPDPADGPSDGLLLLVKPRLNFTEPPELLAYQRRAAGAAFPQQTTLDQFFDEEQWECYRRFGEIVGEQLFAEGAAWSPGRLLKEGVRPTRPTRTGGARG